MLGAFLKWIRFLNPANLILIKRIVDALDALVRLIEQLFNCGEDKEKDK